MDSGERRAAWSRLIEAQKSVVVLAMEGDTGDLRAYQEGCRDLLAMLGQASWVAANPLPRKRHS